jgi:8-oxo-dGTP pyrophosphatase MutT (NUDIX family)
MNDPHLSLDGLSGFLKERLRWPLPGAEAHRVMFPAMPDSLRPAYAPGGPVKEGSVLVLLYEESGLIRFPLIKRASYPGIHGGQISLPGGKAEPGENAVETALREGEEEIGIRGDRVTVIGKLTGLHVVVSNFFVTPVVGVLKGKPEFIPDPYEVERVLVCSVHQLVNQQEILKKEILAAGNVQLLAPHFQVEEEVVWGATAMVLNEFRMVLAGARQP